MTKPRKRPICYGCDRRAARGRRFCTAKCAGLYAEELIRGNDDQYCPACDTWQGLDRYSETPGILMCKHPALDIVEG